MTRVLPLPVDGFVLIVARIEILIMPDTLIYKVSLEPVQPIMLYTDTKYM